MVIGTKYNMAVVGTGISGTVVDHDDGIVTKMYLPSAFHDARVHRNRESHFMRALSGLLPTLQTPEYNSQAETSSDEGPTIPVLTMKEMDGAFKNPIDVVIESEEQDEFVILGQQTAEMMAEIHAAKPLRFGADKQKSVMEVMIDQTEAFDVKAEDRRGFYHALREHVRQAESSTRVVFCHGDLNYSNVMFDQETGNIAGIIDFAFSGYGMPETDFFHFNFPGLLDEVIEAYEAKTGRQFSEERLKVVMLVNNMRAFVATENILSGDLPGEDWVHFQEDLMGCWENIQALSEEFGIQQSLGSNLLKQKPA